MAELFSLMQESSSCKSDRVEATRSLLRTSLSDPFQRNAPTTGEISGDARSASLGALSAAADGLAAFQPEAEQHPHPALRATFSRREKDQEMPNAFSLREKVPDRADEGIKIIARHSALIPVNVCVPVCVTGF